jgi:ATP-dependent protease ClpP protease subunit
MPVYVAFLADVTSQSVETLQNLLTGLASVNTPELHLLMSTTGGHTMYGLTLYNLLRALPMEIVTYNIGSVDSAGIMPFLAGQRRYACPQATFLFHGVTVFPPVGQPQGESELRRFLDYIRAEETRIGSLYVERTRMSPKIVKQVFRTPRTIHAAEAVSLGIVDELRDVAVPPNRPMISVFNPRPAGAA